MSEDGIVLEHLPNYVIYQNGKIWSKFSKKFMRIRNQNGYGRVCLYCTNNGIRKRKSYLKHRLLAEAFLENEHGYTVVNHKDGNRNNNLLNNLEWTTPRGNTQHAFTNGLIKCYKREVIQCSLDGQEICRYSSVKKASEAIGCFQGSISRACSGRRKTLGKFIWKYASKKEAWNVLPDELWKYYPKDDLYLISSKGRVYTRKHNCIMSLRQPTDGYVVAKINCKVTYVHKLVAVTFLSNPHNLPQVNHIDGNKMNNCIDNLEWISQSDNIRHAYRIGLNQHCHLIKQYSSEGQFLKEYKTVGDAATDMNVHRTFIQKACINKSFVKGFIFRYGSDDELSETDVKNMKQKQRTRKIIQFSHDDEFIGNFESIRDAHHKTRIARFAISMVCKGQRDLAGGFKWKYAK